jgi:DnaJ-domain-containing protein 1
MFGSEADKRIPVTLTLVGGEVLRGSVPSGASASLAFELNREGLFLNLKTGDGQIRYVAKSTIAQVVEGAEEKTVALPETVQGRSPYRVLKVKEGASMEEIRQAYVKLAKIYHPDSYHSDSTAPEITEYVTKMFQQITAAYAAIKDAPSKAA